MQKARPMAILCVDDEKIPLLLRARVLERLGFEVVSAASAGEALEIMRTRRFDLVLSDQLMPGMTGTQLAQQVKNNYGIPVVLVSGVNEVPDGMEFVDLFISKLDGPVALCESINSVLEQRTNFA